MIGWHYCKKCKEAVKSCEHDPSYTILASDNSQRLKRCRKLLSHIKEPLRNIIDID